MKSASLPPDDGSIERALADVNAKLADWSAAIGEAQSVLSNTGQPQAQAQLPGPCAYPGREVADAGNRGASAKLADESISRLAQGDAAPTGQPTPPSQQDDEVLLASLDPETARAIRIQRRLDPSKRSVRELLKECGSTHSVQSPLAPKKRLWWTRK